MKRNEIIVYEHKKGVRAVKYNAKPQGHIEPPKPRNPVAKNAGAAIGGGAAGAHKDAKKASQAVRGQKHKNAEMAEASKPRNPTRDHLRRYPVPADQMAKPVKKEKKGAAEKHNTENLSELSRELAVRAFRGAEKKADKAYTQAQHDIMSRKSSFDHPMDDPAVKKAQRQTNRFDAYIDKAAERERGVEEDNTRQKIVDLARGLLDKYHGSMEPEDAYQKVANELDIDIEALYDLLGDDSLLGSEEEWYDRNGRPNPNGAYDAGGHYHLDRDVDEMIGRRSNYYNPMDDERDQQRQMDHDRREFKRQELQHELGHERNNIQVVINGKKWKVFPGKGYADSSEERMNLRKMQQWADNKSAATGKKWEVYLTGASPTVDEAEQEVGKITKVDPATKKATIAKPDGSTQEIDSTALKPTADGKMQMDAPDDDELKTGTAVVSTEGSTEEEMMLPPTDSTSPIHGGHDHDQGHDEIIHLLRKLAGVR